MGIIYKARMLIGSFWKVPFLVPYWDKEESRKIKECFRNGKIIGGDEIEKFEKEIADYFNVKYVATVNLGRSAIELALRGLGLKKGDEVILPSFACRGVVLPIIKICATPVFADINDDLNICPESIEKNITKRTRAIIVPHLSGKIADIDKIKKIAKKHKLFIIDDAAQAAGAVHNGKYAGTLGDAGILSIGYSKNMMATTGGVLMTDNRAIFEKIIKIKIGKETEREVKIRTKKFLRRYKYRKWVGPIYTIFDKIACRNTLPPYEAKKISNLDASIGRIQLKKLREINQRSIGNSHQLDNSLKNLRGIILPKKEDNIFTKFTIILEDDKAKEFSRFMKTKRIETELSYKPLHLNPEFGKYKRRDLPNTDKLWRRVISLPVSPILGKKEMDYTAKKVRKFFS